MIIDAQKTTHCVAAAVAVDVDVDGCYIFNVLYSLQRVLECGYVYMQECVHPRGKQHIT